MGGHPLDGFLYSPWCVILAEITFYTPFVLRPVLAAFSQVPRDQLDVAASLGARPGRVIVRLLLPEALSALAVGGSLTLLLTLNGFGIVLFIVSAGLDRTDPAYAQVAASLGAAPLRVLWQVRLPMLLPSLAAAASLSVALSMGEVGATIMVYPPDWRTLPVSVFALTDRGKVFLAAAETLLLLATTLAMTAAIGLLARRRGTARSRA